MSIVIAVLNAAPSISEDAKQREEDLDARIEAIVKGLYKLYMELYFNLSLFFYVLKC